MRRTIRLFQAAHVAPYQPTGITGLLTHPAPRITLISLYSQTLEALAELPATSVYRTSTENLTKTRLSVIEKTIPFGYDEYKKQVDTIRKKYGLDDPRTLDAGVKAATMRAALEDCRNEAHPDDVANLDHIEKEEGIWKETLRKLVYGDETGQILPEATLDQANAVAGKNEVPASPPPPGKVTHDGSSSVSKEDKDKIYEGLLALPREPALTPNQIANIENEIGAGLVEELIVQGTRELELVKSMKELKAWEDLEHPAPEGQWVAFERTA